MRTKKGSAGIWLLSLIAFAVLSSGLVWGIENYSIRRAASEMPEPVPETPPVVEKQPATRPVKVSLPEKEPETAPRTVQVAAPALPVESDIPEHERVYVVENGRFEIRREKDVVKFGYHIVDLSDDAVPFIFTETDSLPNRYRQTFINIANDRTNEQGEELQPGQHNYVELFGIPPSLSVLAGRFQEDEKRDCYSRVNIDFFRQTRQSVIYQGRRNVKDEIDEVKKRVDAARKKTGKTLAQLSKMNEYAALVREYNNASGRMAMVTEAQRRLACEGLLGNYTPGVITPTTVQAIRDFEHKHMIYGWGILAGDTRAGFGRTPLQNNFDTLKRVLEARVTWSLGIIEDGSVNGVKGMDDTWKDKEGNVHKVRNLVQEYTDLLLEKMQLDTPEKARDFFLKIESGHFSRFRVAFAGPPLPEYYDSDMDFSVVIDRGDVYYDAPTDAAGNRRNQPAHNRPRTILYLNYEGQRIPLVRLGTTIGGWRREFRDGKEYLAYKGSDVGAHIWKDIYAAPVWIPPHSTPPSSLVKSRMENGKWVTRVNREEMGPSYASAYGLVAAIHIRHINEAGRPIWQDNGIRSHGSVDYMSIMRSFSHGCHRLHNHLAIRLFSFVLHHRAHERIGQTKMRYNRRFQVRGQDYHLNIDTRGYHFSLTRAIPVMVEEGRILGRLKEPFRGYLPVPGQIYDPDDPHLRSIPDEPDSRKGPVVEDRAGPVNTEPEDRTDPVQEPEPPAAANPSPAAANPPPAVANPPPAAPTPPPPPKKEPKLPDLPPPPGG